MKDFRGPLPLTDADFAAIRANVMTKVRPRRTLLVWRLAFAAVIAAFAGLITWNTVSFPETPPAQASVEPRPLRPAVPALATAAPQHPAAETAAAPQVAAPIRVSHRKPRTETPTPDAPQFRMEFQTADPDIRIIWLPAQTPGQIYDPKSNTLEETL